MFGWFRKRRRQIHDPISKERDRQLIVTKFYNDARNFRCVISRRDNGTLSYYFESLMDLSDEPVFPTPEIWWEDNSHSWSGVYDSVEIATAEAKRDPEWIRNNLTAFYDPGSVEG